MKTTLITLLFAITANSQTMFNRDVTSVNTQLISPNIELTEYRTSIAASLENISGYTNIPIEAKYDTFIVGAGYNYQKENNYSNAELYIGRVGSDTDKFRGSLIFGVYKIDSDPLELNKQGDPWLPRRASYAGGSLSYHPNENNYFGLTVRDVYDVAFTDGDDKTYFRFEAITPHFFMNINLWNNGFEGISLYSDASHNSVDKTKYTASLEYKNNNFKIGGFYRNYKSGGYIQYNFEYISIYVSQSDKTNLGIIIR